MKRQFKDIIWLCLFSIVLLQACSDDGVYEIPSANSGLQNDLIKRSLGPNIVGGTINFAYAMAILPSEGKITECSVVASIAGATGTYLDNNSYYTNNNGVDVGVPVGGSSTTTGVETKVVFTKDTSAATLRYSYLIPEEARGKTVAFKFTAKSSNGQTVSYETPAYAVSNMDMVLDLTAKDASASYLSISDMKLYSASEAAANPSKVDLIYLYRATPANFGHALVAPTADAIYLSGVDVPSGATNNTKIIKSFNVRDQQLARLQYGVYVDELDLKVKDFANAPNFITDLAAEYGAWVQTADGKYNAFVYINTINSVNKEMRVSIKRLKVN